jgi:hypothetical protein
VKFQTGSGIIGSPITYQLDGVQYVAVPSVGIGGDMIFYYKEPKAGNLWVFALDGGPKREMSEPNLVTRVGSLPSVGEPGSTLGGRVCRVTAFLRAKVARRLQERLRRNRPARMRIRRIPPRGPFPKRIRCSEMLMPSPVAERCTGRAASGATWPREVADRRSSAQL